MAVQLSTNAEISFDINIPSNNDYDYRYWILPKSQFNGMNYPPYAFWFHKKSSRVECNEMLNGNYRYSSVKIQSTKTNEYVTMKYVKNGTEISAYVDDTLIYTNTCEWIDNYTDYCISLMKWTGDKTMLIKNVKVKPL